MNTYDTIVVIIVALCFVLISSIMFILFPVVETPDLSNVAETHDITFEHDITIIILSFDFALITLLLLMVFGITYTIDNTLKYGISKLRSFTNRSILYREEHRCQTIEWIEIK